MLPALGWLLPSAPPPAPPHWCSKGQVQSKCYTVVQKSTASVREARLACERAGVLGRLAEPDSEAEYALMTQALLYHHARSACHERPYFWLGASPPSLSSGFGDGANASSQAWLGTRQTLHGRMEGIVANQDVGSDGRIERCFEMNPFTGNWSERPCRPDQRLLNACPVCEDTVAAASPVSSRRRLGSAVVWELSSAGQSCTDHCASHGLQCIETVWPTSVAQFQAILTEMGHTCSQGPFGGVRVGSFAPFQLWGSHCWWDGSQSTCSGASAANGGASRFCPCV